MSDPIQTAADFTARKHDDGHAAWCGICAARDAEWQRRNSEPGTTTSAHVNAFVAERIRCRRVH